MYRYPNLTKREDTQYFITCLTLCGLTISEAVTSP